MFSHWNGSDTVIPEKIVRNGFVFYPNTGLAEFSGIRKSFYNTAAQTILGMLLANYPSSTPADLIQEELPHRPVGKLMADFKASIRAVWPQIRVERTQKGYRMLLMQ